MTPLELKTKKLLDKRTLSLSNEIDGVFELLYRILSAEINKYKRHEGNERLRKKVLEIKAIFKDALQDETLTIITEGNSIAFAKNKSLLNSIISGKGSQEIIKEYLKSEIYKVNLNLLSPRIWRVTKPYFSQIEILLNAGFYEGKSAKSIAFDLRKLAKKPDAMSIAEIDELLATNQINKYQYNSLKKNIVNYKPGRGVYKSALDNAYRVARNEFNIAYRTQDYLTAQKFDFVKGWKVQLSGQHPVFDMCDDLVGKYPKDYKFTGFHVNCICFATPILATEKETAKILQGQKPTFTPVSKFPNRALKWISDNSTRLKKMKSPPYWLNDNKKYFDL